MSENIKTIGIAVGLSVLTVVIVKKFTTWLN